MSMNAEEVRKKVVKAVLDAGYTISGFANSDVPKKLGIKGGNTLRCLLGGNSISLKTFSKLYLYFGLGELERKIETVRTVTYKVKPGTATGQAPAPAKLTRIPVKKSAAKAPAKKTATKAPVKKSAAPAPRKITSVVKSLKNAPTTKKLIKSPAKQIKKKALA
jgi:hypothetical protein